MQYSLASLVYFTVSKLFPPHETVLEHAIIDIELEPPIGDKGSAGSSEGVGGQDEVTKFA